MVQPPLDQARWRKTSRSGRRAGTRLAGFPGCPRAGPGAQSEPLPTRQASETLQNPMGGGNPSSHGESVCAEAPSLPSGHVGCLSASNCIRCSHTDCTPTVKTWLGNDRAPFPNVIAPKSPAGSPCAISMEGENRKGHVRRCARTGRRLARPCSSPLSVTPRASQDGGPRRAAR